MFPYHMVPALPPKSTKINDDYLTELMKYYNRFLNAICKSEVLKTCGVLVGFLKMDN
jgi:hypothetical protein